MKSGIHPESMTTKVHCNGCGNDFETQATVASITVEICSNCHPFYTGKQKLVDTAGRVEKFRARAEAAQKRKDQASKKADKEAAEDRKATQANDPQMAKIERELEQKTVDLPEQKAEDNQPADS